MYFIYIDDSTDRPTNVFSAMAIPHEQWSEAFDYIKLWRKYLKDVHDIPVGYELHATELLSGRGSSNRLRHLSRGKRAQIFHKTFRVVEYMKRYGVLVFNVCNNDDNQFRAFERLLNRINRNMNAKNDFAHLVCDEGKEHQYTTLVRKMKIFNPIPSNTGVWPGGAPFRNITLDRILEDPQFKRSSKSYFIQTVDFVAFGLLRRERPTPAARRQRIHRSFDQLTNITVKECNPRDPYGIIR